MVKNPFFSRFASSIFSRDGQTDRHSDPGTHPLIESIRQRLKMVRFLKLSAPYYVKRMKINDQLLLCEAPNRWIDGQTNGSTDRRMNDKAS